MAVRARKVTFSLHTDLLTVLDDAMARGVAPSKNAFVERALWRALQEVRREARRARWEEASRDPLFLSDLAETTAAFASADAESDREAR
jgi:hypothetical protein